MKLSVSLLLPLLVTSQETSLGAGARLRKQQYSGNGCPQGSANIAISETGKWITITYSKFRTYVGPNYLPTEKSRNYQFQLYISAPSNEFLPQGVQAVQYTFAGSGYEGHYTQLDVGVTAVHYSTYYFSDLDTFTISTLARFDGGELWRAPGRFYVEIQHLFVDFTVCSLSWLTALMGFKPKRP
ncbi:hypothetical protein QBC36DRAFT_199812 [Triangularia setosa]|uniref:Secreted protein n=1 Tax=Triangularia setosa TaxID=2587417 RepID=A0AAN7A3P1_9PEZI|nr:hypothetical protein QBC36DRAFT_199812 [Podospora setosa]